MKTTLILLCLFFGVQAQAQSDDPNVISNSGGADVNASYQISFTIGEIFTGTISNTNDIEQGFWAGISTDNILSTDDFNPEDNTILFYPNPVTNFLNVHIKNTNEYNMMLTNIHGQLVMQKTITVAPQGNNIDVRALPKGMYILTLQITKSKQNKSFKIIKN
ncbi:hypothetical protein GCM10022393_37410 [Aquimarina addita]|uniref:Secretion system C-terminal sorting domain-containing protein n=1 Tax=Aquimarina addita TaxID=870485 RepID=A0ABP6USH0_9FLAO